MTRQMTSGGTPDSRSCSQHERLRSCADAYFTPLPSFLSPGSTPMLAFLPIRLMTFPTQSELGR